MSNDVIKIKAFHNSANMVTYVEPNITLDKLNKEVSELWQFGPDQLFTIKWIDDEGDPCLLSCQDELEEMLRLHDRTNCKEPEVILHVFKNHPIMPGMPCPGEDGNIYRRGAIRWREKTKYKIYGHIYEPKRLKTDTCAYCHDMIWGLGSGGFKCINCKLMVHKKCHKLCKNVCGSRPLFSENNFNMIPLRPSNEVGRPNRPFITSNEQNIDMDQDGRPPHYTLEDFELLRVIGRGSYAKVLMAELKKTNRIYAMKVIKKEMFVGNENEDIDWVQTEKHVFEQASNYPFLVGLHSCFQNESRLFFVIEFVRGGDLMYHMQRKRRLLEPEARFYAAEISLALDFLHMRGIIYRDLKLDNVLLDHEGHIKLTDYGMCKEGIFKGEKTSTFCGTPNYISPELLRGEEYDFSVDWWALGVLLYEMLAGRSPFDTNTENANEDILFQIILEKTIRIPRGLSVKAQNILRGFLKKDPKERLGCDPDKGFSEVQLHEFFKDIDWKQLERRQVQPPYTPPTESDRDLAHFDPNFTQEPVCFTPDDMDKLSRVEQSEFEGFEYVNPLLMSVEDVV